MATNATAHIFYGVQLSEERALELFGEYSREDMRTLDDLQFSDKVEATGLDFHVFKDAENSEFIGAYLGRELGSTGEICYGSDFTVLEFNAEIAADVKNKLAKIVEITEPVQLYLFTDAY